MICRYFVLRVPLLFRNYSEKQQIIRTFFCDRKTKALSVSQAKRANFIRQATFTFKVKFSVLRGSRAKQVNVTRKVTFFLKKKALSVSRTKRAILIRKRLSLLK